MVDCQPGVEPVFHPPPLLDSPLYSPFPVDIALSVEKGLGRDGDVGSGGGDWGDDDVVGSDPDVSEVMRDVDICFRRSAAIFRPISTSFLVTLSRAGRGCRPWPFETLAYKQSNKN